MIEDQWTQGCSEEDRLLHGRFRGHQYCAVEERTANGALAPAGLGMELTHRPRPLD